MRETMIEVAKHLTEDINNLEAELWHRVRDGKLWLVEDEGKAFFRLMKLFDLKHVWLVDGDDNNA